jgi:hypothetical protein
VKRMVTKGICQGAAPEGASDRKSLGIAKAMP